MSPDSLITQQKINPSKLERAKEMRREMSCAERNLWAKLKANRLEGFHFRRQQVIEPFIVDFYCFQAALVVEVDGEIHQFQQEYDRQRDQFLRDSGLVVMHFTNCEVTQNLDRVLEEILRTCRKTPVSPGNEGKPSGR